MRGRLFLIIVLFYKTVSAQDTVALNVAENYLIFSKPIFSCSIFLKFVDSTAEIGTYKCTAHLAKAAVPCPGSCNRINTFVQELNIRTSTRSIKRLFDSANRMAQTYFFDKFYNSVIEYFENGNSIICKFTTDSGSWYGEMSAEIAVKEAWNVKYSDSINYGMSLLKKMPFYPGYAILPSGVWTFKNTKGTLLLRHYKIKYSNSMKNNERNLELEEL